MTLSPGTRLGPYEVAVQIGHGGRLAGMHLIDFYPGIYQGPEGGQQLYRLPQLTYADDHPGNRIPALRFAFEVTRGTSSAR